METASDDMAEQYVNAKTSVWWNIDSCSVPDGCDGLYITRKINSALCDMGYRGSVSISAYGDMRLLPLSLQQALSSTGVTLNHVPSGAKDASDKKILVDILFWAIKNYAPANLILISRGDFANLLCKLRNAKYNVLLVQPSNSSLALATATMSVGRCPNLVMSGDTMSKNEPTKPVVYQFQKPYQFQKRSEYTTSSSVLPTISLDISKLSIPDVVVHRSDCICFKDIKYRNFDIKKALDVATKRQMVTTLLFGASLMYIREDKRIWNCINPEGGDPEHYPKAILEQIQQFLISSGGQSAKIASSCKYEAALVLKQSCLQNVPLGGVIRIINMLVGTLKWIKPNHSGWKPVTITLSEGHVNPSTQVKRLLLDLIKKSKKLVPKPTFFEQ